MNTLSWLVDDSFSTRLTLALLHFLWQGCCVGSAVLGCGALLRGASAQWRYSMNLVALLALAACLPVTFLLVGSSETGPLVARSLRDTALPPESMTASSAQDNSVAAEVIGADEQNGLRNPAADIGPAPSELSSFGISPADWSHSLASLLTTNIWPALARWVAPLYLTGVAFILARLVFAVWGGHRLRKRSSAIEEEALLASFRKLAQRVGLKLVPAVAWCEEISVPVVVGIVKPMILLPLAVVSNLTPDQLQALMLHELSHIRRYDPIVNLLQRIVEAILFFHPVVWFVSRRISIERELAADDMVLAAGWDRPLYAEALVRMAELATTFSTLRAENQGAVLASSGTSPSEFKLRVLRLLGTSRPPKFALSRTSMLLALALLFVGGLFAWSQTQQPATGDPVDAAAIEPNPPPPEEPLAVAEKPSEEIAEHAKGLEFLKAYPALRGLSLDMTELRFLEILKQHGLKTTTKVAGDRTHHHLNLEDGHTLIVMFEKGNDKCRGIQRIRGDQAGIPRILQKPAILLPDRWMVTSVGFDNEEKELVTASTQSLATIRRWDLVGKKLISEIKLAGDKHGRALRGETLQLSADRKRVIAATDAYVGIWETATGKLLTKLPIPKIEGNDTVRLLSCTPDFSVVVGDLTSNYERMTLVYDAHTLVWDGNTGKLLQTLTHKRQNHFFALSLASDGKRFVTTNGGGATIWDTNNGEQLLHVPNDNTGRQHSDPEVSVQATQNVWSVQFSPSGKQLAMGDMLGVKLIDAASGKLLQQLEAPYRYSSGTSPNLVFSQDGQWLARLGTGDRIAGEQSKYVVPIWSTSTGEKRYELVTEANGVDFSADGQRLAVGFSDIQQGLAVWQLACEASEQPAGPGPEPRQDKVEENGHYRGKTAAEFVEKFKPTWGETQLGMQYGIALTKPQQQYRRGERVPLVAFFRNASDEPIKVDMRPDYFGNPPKVVNAKGVAVELENIPLVGYIPHYVENLEPGEAVGPFYLSFGLSENPRPGKQHWHPYYKTPDVGKYQLTHRVPVGVKGPKDGEQAQNADLTSGTVAFEIVAGDQPAAPKPTKKTEAVPPKDKSNYVKVTGQLLDADTGKPIEQASWESGMASLEKPKEVAWGHSKTLGGSYPEGRFEQLVHFTPDGRFDRLRVYAAGYETTIVINDLPNPRPLEIERVVKLKRGQTITGTLRDHAGQPVANGWVFFIPVGHRSNIVEGLSGTDPYRLPQESRDGAVAEARTNTAGQFVLAAGSAGTLAASSDAVDLWPFPVPADGNADLTLPEPAHLVIDLTYWYLDELIKKGKRVVSPDSEDPNQCWIQVDRAGERDELWKSLEYRRQMLVFSLNPRQKLAKGVSVGPIVEGEWDKPIPDVGHNKNIATKIRIALPPGSYRVQRLKAGPFAPVDEQNIELKPGADTVLNWSRGDGAAVKGLVTWPSNLMFVRQEGAEPRKLDWTVPSMATVTISNAAGKAIEAAKIQPDGKFFIATHLEPGKYQATATVYLPERDFRGGYRGADCVATENFEISDPARAPFGSPPVNVELSLEAGGTRFVPALK